MVPAHDSGDHTHPSPTGYRFLGDFIDIGLLKGRDCPYPWSGVVADVDGDEVLARSDLDAVRGTMGRGTRHARLRPRPTSTAMA